MRRFIHPIPESNKTCFQPVFNFYKQGIKSERKRNVNAPLCVVCVQAVSDHLEPSLAQLDGEGGVLKGDEVQEDFSGGCLQLV